MRYDVIIIGGGVSGIVTGLYCVDAGFRVAIIEKKDSLGGRIQTITRGTSRYEAGAGCIATSHARTCSLLKRFHLTCKRAHAASSHILRIDGGHESFVQVKEGMGEWIQRMVDHLHSSGKASIFTNRTVKGWSQQGRNKFTVDAWSHGLPHVSFESRSIVCTLPQNELLNEQHDFKWTPEQRKLLTSVNNIALHRLFGKFPVPKNQTPWFFPLQAQHTKGPLGMFAPANKQSGLMMLSFTQDRDAKQWHNVAQKGDSALRAKLLESIHVTFPEVPTVTNPVWLESHFWDTGIHAWKKGTDVQNVHKKLLQPYGNHVAWFLAGETYSLCQGWIEGALMTVDEIVPRLFEMLRLKKNIPGIRAIKTSGGSGLQSWVKQKHHRLAWEDLDTLRQNFPETKWVFLRDPTDHKLKVLDVTRWMFEHPGGSHPFEKHMFQNITKEFENIVSHKQADGKWNPKVIEAIQKHTIAEIK